MRSIAVLRLSPCCLVHEYTRPTPNQSDRASYFQCAELATASRFPVWLNKGVPLSPLFLSLTVSFIVSLSLVHVCGYCRYACVNMSCFVLSVIQSPGFRPSFKWFSWHTSLAGVCLCIALMLIVSWEVSRYMQTKPSFFITSSIISVYRGVRLSCQSSHGR